MNEMTDNTIKMICLCGSTRFTSIIKLCEECFEYSGFIVLSPFMKGTAPLSQPTLDKQKIHFEKIRRSDVVVIVSDHTGYIGEHTKMEIAYATKLEKPVYYLHNELDNDVCNIIDACYRLRYKINHKETTGDK